MATTTSTMLIAFCATMNTLLNHILLRKRMVPFTTSIGLNRDTTMAGKTPDSKAITKYAATKLSQISLWPSS